MLLISYTTIYSILVYYYITNHYTTTPQLHQVVPVLPRLRVVYPPHLGLLCLELLGCHGYPCSSVMGLLLDHRWGLRLKDLAVRVSLHWTWKSSGVRNRRIALLFGLLSYIENKFTTFTLLWSCLIYHPSFLSTSSLKLLLSSSASYSSISASSLSLPVCANLRRCRWNK